MCATIRIGLVAELIGLTLENFLQCSSVTRCVFMIPYVTLGQDNYGRWSIKSW